jgi:catalase
MVLPDGEAAVKTLASDGHTLEFLKDQYRHCKPILVLGASSRLLKEAKISSTLPSGKADPGLFTSAGDGAVNAFVASLATHRQFARETDPPLI